MSAGALASTAGPPAGQVTAMRAARERRAPEQALDDRRIRKLGTFEAGPSQLGMSGTGLAGDKVDDEALLAWAQHPDLACVDLEDRGRLEFGELAGQLRSLRLQLGKRLLLGAQDALGRKVPAERPDIAQPDGGEQTCDDDRAWTRRERTPERRAGRGGPPYVLGTPPAPPLLQPLLPQSTRHAVGALSRPLRASARRTRPRRSMSPPGRAAPRSAAAGCTWRRARCATARRS